MSTPPQRTAQKGDQRQVLLAEMFTAAQLAQGGITSQQIAQATARLSENSRDPKVAEAIRHRQDASAKLADLYRQRDELADAQRQGATIAPSAVSRRRPRQADQRTRSRRWPMPMRRCRRRRRITASWCSRWCRPRTCSRRCIRGEAFAAIALSDDDGWVFLLRNGTIAVSKIDGGVKQIGRTGAPHPRRHRTDDSGPADVRHRRCPEAVPADARRRGRARSMA